MGKLKERGEWAHHSIWKVRLRLPGDLSVPTSNANCGARSEYACYRDGGLSLEHALELTQYTAKKLYT